MYVKKKALNGIKYYIAFLVLMSSLQVIMAITIERHDAFLGWEENTKSEVHTSTEGNKEFHDKDFGHKKNRFNLFLIKN